MNIFYDPNAQAGIHELELNEARHLSRVLRRRVDDEVQVVDGQGSTFVGNVQAIQRDACTLNLRKSETLEKRAPYRLTLAVGPTKKADRMEWLLEKATEVGFDRFQPVLCQYGERSKMRQERLKKVMISAMKQSLQSWLPQLDPLKPLREFLSEKSSDQKFIAHIDSVRTSAATQSSLPQRQLGGPGGYYEEGRDVTILIGPEGGFSPAELEQARAAGYLPISLGPNRLRTETAALYALQCISLLNLSSPS